GAVSWIDFRALATDSATSGIGVYLDTGTVQDEWDASDAPVTLASVAPTVFPPGGVAFTITFPAPGLDVPDANAGAFDIFFVVRSDAIETGDAFDLRIEAYDVAVRGLLAPQGDTVDADLATPLPFAVIPSSRVLGDSTPPRLRNLQWTEASAYLGALGLDLYFVNTMPATQVADATGQARDDESGLLEASFSAESSLASSPGPVSLFGAGAWRAWSGTYGFAAASTDASSPAVVTVTDQVGNAITTDALGSNFRYIQTTQAILIQPNPGWIPPGGPFWVDPAGKLWFGNLIQGVATVTLRVDIISLFGGGLANVSASVEPSLAGGPFPAFRDFPPGVDAATHGVDYQIAANSTGASSPVRLTAFDNSGNSVTADFEYGLDTEGPVITIDYPTTGAALTGTFTVRATVSDALTAVDRVELEVDPFGGFQRMFFDGTAYFLPISSALWPDGPHRLIVRATDMVDNAHAVGVDVVFGNAASDTTAPTAAFVAPAAGELVRGVLVFRVSAADAGGIQAVELTVFGQTVPMVFNAATGYWEYAFDSRSITDNRYTGTVVVTDEAGLQTTATVSFAVQNGDAWGSLLDATPFLLLLFLIVAFVLVVWMMRRGLWGAARRKEKGPPPPEG
ncbi:MAG: Ig-like domain-containing protein, partial [Euryarchaeota archaeon]|nr:Ig-like domain-containing protein [Euryarchaeota archaeon]